MMTKKIAKTAKPQPKPRVDERGVPLRWAGYMLGWMPVDAEYFTGRL